jgi:hypothetical protein
MAAQPLPGAAVAGNAASSDAAQPSAIIVPHAG